jgi:sec-independent protein translocase protein TatA
MGISIWQILIIVLIVVVLFGAGRIPRLMGDMAKGIKSFKAGMKDEEETTVSNTSAQSQGQVEHGANQSTGQQNKDKANS